MSRKSSSLGTRLAIATALAIGASGTALADDSTMNPFTGDFYPELHGGQNLGDSIVARAPRPSFKAAALPAPAKSGRQQSTKVDRLLMAMPTPIFSDKGV